MLEEMDSYTKDKKQEIIYIPLLNEGTPVLRPTRGILINPEVYKVLPTKEYDPSDEQWKFLPGEIVRCEKQNIQGKEVLVAIEINVDSLS